MQLTFTFTSCTTLILGTVLIWGQETTSDDDISISKRVEQVIANDNKLCEQSSQNKQGDGKVVRGLMREFNGAFSDIVERVSKDLKKGDNTTKIEAEPLLKHGCPKFINFYVEHNVIEDRFEVNNKTLEIISRQRQKAIDLWVEFFALYYKAPDLDGVQITVKN